MRRVLACSVLALALGLAGCGGGGTGGAVTPSSTVASVAGDTPSAATSPGGGGGDCSGLTKNDLAAFIVGTQLLAQVRDLDTLKGATSGAIGNYSPESFGAILAKMSFLTGDAAEGLATITAANDAVKRLAAGSPSQADLDAYQQQTGGIAGILKAQLAVNLGLAKACPSLA